MQHEPGDEYLRRLATFIRTNEKSLAEAGLQLRRRPAHKPGQKAEAVSVFNPLGWFGYDATSHAGPPPPKPITLTMDTHRLFYVLMRLEALGIDVGTLDVQIDSPSRPMSYINVLGDVDKSETMSLASIRTSLSVVSGLSLGGGWWSKPEPPSVDSELKYIYSSFTKVPALSIQAPGKKGIAELANEAPNQNAIPLDVFKTLHSLECVDIDPRTLLGWDKLAESLRSLKIKKSGLEDVSDIFIGAVVDDQARREGSTSRKRRRKIPRGIPKDAEPTFFATRLPDMVVEDTDGEESAEADDQAQGDTGSSIAPESPTPNLQLSSLKWAFLKHLSLSDNGLTFFPTDPLNYLTSLTHLDLSSNLLVSVPPGLGGLYNLVSLNLADNMIDSVLGIYTNLGQVLYLNLAQNRLESICGLERLTALERVDLRGNYIDESAEIGRLAVLPNIADVRIEGNPFTEVEENYRVACFDHFWKEGKTVKLDGAEPGFYEKKNLSQAPSAQMSSSRPPSVAYSPPVVAVNHAHTNSPSTSATTSPPPRDGYPTPPSSNASPYLGPAGAKARRKKVKRIVDLDGGEQSDGRASFHSRERSDASSVQKKLKPAKKKAREASPQPAPQAKWGQMGTLTAEPEEDLVEEAGTKAESTEGLLAPSAIDRSSSTATVTPTSSNITVTPESPQKPKPVTRSRHGRYQTEFIPSMASVDFNDDLSFKPSSVGDEVIGVSPKGSGSMRRPPQRSGTMGSRSGARKNRVSASVYEPPSAPGEASGIEEARDSADAYRKRLEALKQDMGDNWLKVFAQSQLRPLSP